MTSRGLGDAAERMQQTFERLPDVHDQIAPLADNLGSAPLDGRGVRPIRRSAPSRTQLPRRTPGIRRRAPPQPADRGGDRQVDPADDSIRARARSRRPQARPRSKVVANPKN
jgi:hypothetical protein